MRVTVVAGTDAASDLRESLGEDTDVMMPGDLPPEGPWVLWLDGLRESEITTLNKQVEAAEERPIAVLGARWDGFSPIPLAALCRGVIAGFGAAGVKAAVAAIERELPADRQWQTKD